LLGNRLLSFEKPVEIAIFLAFLLKLTIYISKELNLRDNGKKLGGFHCWKTVIKVAHYLVHGLEKQLVQLEETMFGIEEEVIENFLREWEAR
jgi:hypothetical protein